MEGSIGAVRSPYVPPSRYRDARQHYKNMIDAGVIDPYRPPRLFVREQETWHLGDGKVLRIRLNARCVAEIDYVMDRAIVCALTCDLLPSFQLNKYTLKIVSLSDIAPILDLLAILSVCHFFDGDDIAWDYITIFPPARKRTTIKYERARFFDTNRCEKEFLQRAHDCVLGTPLILYMLDNEYSDRP